MQVQKQLVEDVVVPKARSEWVGNIDPSGGQHLFRAVR